MQSPPILTRTSPPSYQQCWSSRSRVIRYPHRHPRRYPQPPGIPRPSPPVLVVVSSVPAATLTPRSPAPPPQTRDGGQTVRTWVAAARPGAAAIVKAGHCSEGCKVFGGCSDCEGTWQRWAGRSGPRPPSSLPSLRTQAWTFAMMPGAPPARFQGL